MIAHVDPDDRPLAMEGKVVLKAGQAVVYPLRWTETATTNLMARFREITNEVGQVVAGLPRD
eukprot:10038841-Alexandrium_andersonii.AAC.1